MNEIERKYEIIGGNESMSDDELYAKYLELRNKYQNDRFLEGEAGNEAARKLTELNEAYADVIEYRKTRAATGDQSAALAEIDGLIKSGKIDEAQAALDRLDQRTAEWHYLQSIIFYKKNWANESKKQLEIAIQMDSGNEKYKASYEKLCKQMNYNEEANKGKKDYNTSGSGRFNERNYEEPETMMGGDGCLDFCCQSIICSALLNCCCSCR